MLEHDKYDKLFATPMLRYHVPDHAALNAELCARGAKLRAISEGVEKSNRHGWHSAGNLFEDPSSAAATLAEIARKAVIDATVRVKARTDPETLGLKLFAWMNANPPGGFNAPHTHPGAHWSGVYYVTQPETEAGNSGMIEFLDPRTDLPNWRLLGAPAFRTKKKIRPAPGELILFPSYLVHWVYPNETDEERISVAFNATFRKPRAANRPAAQETAEDTNLMPAMARN